MIRPTKKYALVERKKIKETTTSGIILTSNQTDAKVVIATIIDLDEEYLDGLKKGDTVYVNKLKALDIESNDELFFVEPEHICGWETN